MTTENDCEDQGFTRIEEGCYNWKCLRWDGDRSVRPTLIPEEYPLDSGMYWWTCPKCGGSYGEAPKLNASKN